MQAQQRSFDRREQYRILHGTNPIIAECAFTRRASTEPVWPHSRLTRCGNPLKPYGSGQFILRREEQAQHHAQLSSGALIPEGLKLQFSANRDVGILRGRNLGEELFSRLARTRATSRHGSWPLARALFSR